MVVLVDWKKWEVGEGDREWSHLASGEEGKELGIERESKVGVKEML